MKINGIEIPPLTAVHITTSPGGLCTEIYAERGGFYCSTTVERATEAQFPKLDMLAKSLDAMFKNLEAFCNPQPLHSNCTDPSCPCQRGKLLLVDKKG